MIETRPYGRLLLFTLPYCVCLSQPFSFSCSSYVFYILVQMGQQRHEDHCQLRVVVLPFPFQLKPPPQNPFNLQHPLLLLIANPAGGLYASNPNSPRHLAHMQWDVENTSWFCSFCFPPLIYPVVVSNIHATQSFYLTVSCYPDKGVHCLCFLTSSKKRKELLKSYCTMSHGIGRDMWHG